MAALKKKEHSRLSVIKVVMISRSRTDCAVVKKIFTEIDPALNFTSTISTGRMKQLIKGADIIVFALRYNDPDRSSIIALLRLQKDLPLIAIGKTKQDIAFTGTRYQHSVLWENLNKKYLLSAKTAIIEKKITNGNVNVNVNVNLKEYKDTEARFLNVILSSADGMIIVNSLNKMIFINPSARKMLGVKKDDTRNLKFPFKFNIDGLHEQIVSVNDRDAIRYLEMHVSEVQWENTPARLISLRDISVRIQAEKSLQVSEERYELATRGSNSGLWDWDLENQTIYYCDQWKEMLGHKCTEISSSPKEWFSRIHPEDIDGVRYAIDLHLSGKTSQFESEHRILHNNGTYRWVLVRGMAVFGKDKKAIRFAGSQTDITERMEAEKELKKSLDDLKFALASEKLLMEELDRKNKELVELSITDGLTGMYNHRFLHERFDYEFKRVRRYGGMLSCMIIDIDHFKLINDTYGHQVGDHVLRQIAGIMKQKSREIDICGRYGGEEFMIITNLQIENALRYATKLHASIENHIFECGTKNVHVTVSIGIAEYNSDVKTKQELIERADSAMYQAKMDGRNLIRIWKDIDAADENSINKYGIQELKGKFQDLSSQMRHIYMESTNALIKAVDAKDPFASEHSKNVADISTEIAKYLKLTETEVEIIHYAGLLHDVGKIGIRDDIIVKKEELTSSEFELLRRHPEVGVNILKDIKFLEKEIPIILHHHERFDGKGYPHGLQGREIPLGARILAVADAFDAMTAGRSYQNKVPWKKAVDEIKRGSGTQFAPEIVDAFVKLEECGVIAPKEKTDN